jgi:hypothetical protein
VHCLSLGQADKATLQRLQRWFEKEDQEIPALMLHAARSERALTHRMLEALWDGRITWKQMQGLRPEADSLWDHVHQTWILGRMRAKQANLLREVTEEIERWEQPWDPTEPDPPQEGEQRKLGQLMVQAVHKVRFAGARAQTLMRCASAAMAAECFRLDKGTWPKSLDELKPAYLKEIAKDPFAAGPIRMVFKEDGLVIYSVWKDGHDDGGNLDRDGHGDIGTDYGFQLWNPGVRTAIALEDTKR